MDAGVAALVLISAVLHASWNALVKLTDDQLLSLTMVMGTCSLIGLAGTFFVEVPTAEVWPLLAISVGIHALYQLFLGLSYRFGDLSHVYPIARGFAPLLVAALAAGGAGEPLSAAEMFGIGVVSLGIASLAFGDGWPTAEGLKPVLLALTTGVMIGSYSFVDGLGVRRAASEFSYIAWQALLAGVPICVIAAVRRRGRVIPFFRQQGARGLVAGVIAMLGYAIVQWAMNQGTMAHVASLRETGVIFAALLGAILLREPFGRRRIAAAAVVAAGVILLNSAA